MTIRAKIAAAGDALIEATIKRGYANTDVDSACAALGALNDTFANDRKAQEGVLTLSGVELWKHLNDDVVMCGQWWCESPRYAGKNYIIAGPGNLYSAEWMNGRCFIYRGCLVHPLSSSVRREMRAAGLSPVLAKRLGTNGTLTVAKAIRGAAL